MANHSSTIYRSNLAYSYSPKVVHVQPKLQTANGLRVAVFGMLISGLVVAAGYTINLRNSLAAPIIEEVPKAVVASPQPDAPKAAPVVAKPAQPSSQDLQKVLNKWQQDYKTAHFGVMIREIGGSKRSASINAHDQFYAASLYKVFLAQYLYNKAESGQLDLNSYKIKGYTVTKCIERMIVVSDNYCGHGLGDVVGWNNLNTVVHQNGFTETITSTDLLTSASDMAEYLERLQGGTLMGRTYTNQIIGYMKRQIYRTSIPAGVPSVSVADKPGYLGSYWHDAAIVYHPKGAYILVIMSRGSGSFAFKDLSRRVSDFFNK